MKYVRVFLFTLQIAGSYHSTYVVLSVVDLNKVYPFGGPPPVSPAVVRDLSPFQKGHSARKSFSKEKPAKEGNYRIHTFQQKLSYCNSHNTFYFSTVLHRPTLLDEKTAEESTSGTEADEDSGAVISNINDYTEIFRPSRACK